MRRNNQEPIWLIPRAVYYTTPGVNNYTDEVYIARPFQAIYVTYDVGAFQAGFDGTLQVYLQTRSETSLQWTTVAMSPRHTDSADRNNASFTQCIPVIGETGYLKSSDTNNDLLSGQRKSLAAEYWRAYWVCYGEPPIAWDFGVLLAPM